MNKLLIFEAPVLHIIFIVIFVLLISATVFFFLMAVTQKSLSWRKRAFGMLIASGIFAIAVAISGVYAASAVDFSNPDTTQFMYLHIFSGSIVVLFSFYLSVFSFSLWHKLKNQNQEVINDKKMIIMVMILLALVFLTLNLGKTVLETGAAQHKQEYLYGP